VRPMIVAISRFIPHAVIEPSALRATKAQLVE
jgi:hypothetical protein